MEDADSVIGSPMLRAVGPEWADRKWRTENSGFRTPVYTLHQSVSSSSLRFGSHHKRLRAGVVSASVGR